MARIAKVRQETRADYYGIKASALSRDAEKKLTALRMKIAKLSEPWAEVDTMIESATEAALRAVDELIKQYKDSAEYLNEPMN